MPAAIIAKVRSSVKKAHPGMSEERVNNYVYGSMNKLGFMHGNKETEKGVAAESRFNADHARKAIRKRLKKK